MKRFLRVGSCAAVLALSLSGAAMWGVQRYVLNSARAATRLAQLLETKLAMPVEVGAVRAGWSTSALEGVKVYPPGEPSAEPWAEVDRLEIRAPAWQLLLGRQEVHELALCGVRVRLKGTPGLDGTPASAAGGPRSAAPEFGVTSDFAALLADLPNVHITDGSLVYRPEGQPEVAIHGIDLDARHEGDGLTLTGTICDPDWGDWDVAGTVGAAAAVELRSRQPVAVSPGWLRRLPGVPDRAWQAVRVEGPMPVRVQVAWSGPGRPPSCRATFTSVASRVSIAGIDLTADDVRGRLVLEAGALSFQGLHGRTADGEIALSGVLHFAEAGFDYQLNVAVCEADVRRLPRSWELPPEIRGRLTGQARLETRRESGRLVYRGEGDGVITGAHLSLIPTGPIRIGLRSDGRRYRFRLLGLGRDG